MIFPKHVALIPDGNRTWAKLKGYNQMIGHLEGIKRIIELIKFTFSNTSIKIFTGWGLSTENLFNRSNDELEYLFEIYKKLTTDLDEYMIKNQINFRWIGNKEGLPANLVNYLRENQLKYSFNTDKYVNFCINYGGRTEILNGIKKINKFSVENNSSIEKIIDQLDEKEFSKFLDFGDLPNVDLVIRTKGDSARRLSGFMLWWIGYAELYFTSTKCPDFTVQEFEKALNRFDEISNERNFGK